jgi:hypothetical protein
MLVTTARSNQGLIGVLRGSTVLKGQAKKDYQREYMRRRRAGLTGSKLDLKACPACAIKDTEIARLKRQLAPPPIATQPVKPTSATDRAAKARAEKDERIRRMQAAIFRI